MRINIRKIIDSDFIQLNQVAKECQKKHVAALPEIFQEVQTAVSADYFKTLINNDESAIFVAEVEGEITGYAIIEIRSSPDYDCLVTRRYAHINDIGVKSSFKRMGVGKALFNACKEYAVTHDVKDMELNVWEFNEEAIEFYHALGMKTLSRKMTIEV